MGGRSRTAVELAPRLGQETKVRDWAHTDQSPESGSFRLPPTPMLSVGSGGRPFSSFRPLLPKDIDIFAKGVFRSRFLSDVSRIGDGVRRTIGYD